MTYAAYLERVTTIVARFTLRGPLPTFFEVKPEGCESGVIVRAKMARIDSREPGDPHVDPVFRTTTTREVLPLGLSDDQIEAKIYNFARCIYDHEFHEWLRLDGELYLDPHADDNGGSRG